MLRHGPSAMVQYLGELHGISFCYRRGRWVLDGLDLTVRPGRTLLLGPNGAGKSTVLRLLAGDLRPSTGQVRVAPGVRVALMPQTIHPVRGLSVREQVVYAGWLAGMRTRDAQARVEEVLGSVNLTALAGRRSHELSGGELRRLGLAEARITGPGLLLLDEPMAGLDPAERLRLLDTLGVGDRSLVMSTHQTEEVDGFFDRVVVLERGRVRFDGGVREFLALDPTGTGRADRAYLRCVEGGRA